MPSKKDSRCTNLNSDPKNVVISREMRACNELATEGWKMESLMIETSIRDFFAYPDNCNYIISDMSTAKLLKLRSVRTSK